MSIRYRGVFLKKWQFFIATGIKIEELSAKVDNKYFLIGANSSTAILFGIPRGIEEPNANARLFYANCLAYDHDVFAYFYSERTKANDIPRPLDNSSSPFFHETLIEMFVQANDLRMGNIVPIFRKDILDSSDNVFYTKKYSKVSEDLRLYSNALIQFDPLFEFLNYFRIIERNHKYSKDWINRNIGRIKDYDFGSLPVLIQKINYRNELESGKRILYSKSDMFKMLKIRVLKRINTLCSNGDIGEIFYNENRGGIAHARRNVKYFEIDYSKIREDCFVLKLLSRIAIEDNLN